MRIARKWELGDKAFSRTATTSFAWKDERRWWLFVVLANGALCYHKVPDIERLDDGQDA
ncbi:hypothetical protein MCOR27_005080 [Pyricularia oryzae]|nr:hypothetical protein MCOR27_005080 [Pyricularia oryzae]